MKSFKNKSEKAAFWLSKYIKVILSQIENENYIEASQNLKWLNQKIIFLFEKADWESILDPRNIYEKREPIDWSTVDLSQVKVVKSTLPEKEEGKIQPIRPESFYSFPNNEFIDSLIAGVYDINKISRGKNEQLGNYARYILMNLFIGINNLEDDQTKLDLNEYLSRELIGKIYGRNYQILSGVTSFNKSSLNVTYLTGIRMYLDLIKMDDLKVDFVPILCNALYDSLRLSVSWEKDEYFRWFVAALVDGGFSASYSKYEITRIKFAVRDEEGNRDDKSQTQQIVDKIDENRGRDIFLNVSQYQEKIKLFANLRKELESKGEIEKELEKFISETEEYFRDKFVESQISLLLLKLQVDLMFKEKFDLVYYIHEYNQPPDSDATFSNKEPYPVFLNQILDWIEHETEIDHSVMMSGFSGHHGITKYLKLTWLISILYAYRNRWRQYVENQDIIRSFADQLKTRQRYTYFKSFFEDLIKRFEFQRERSKLFEKFEKPVLDGVKELLDSILKNVEESEKKAKKQAKLRAESIDNVAKNTIELYNSNKFYAREDVLNIATSGEEHEGDFIIGVNQFRDREYFSEDFEAPIFGLSDNFARELYETENLLIESGIVQKLEHKGEIRLNELEKILDEHVAKDKTVIVENVHLSSLLDISSEKFDYDHFNQDPYYGGTYNECTIYSLRQFGESSLLVIENHKKGSVEFIDPEKWKADSFKKHDDVYYKIIDFKTDKLSMDSFLKNPPEWLTQDHETEEERIEFLKTKVWIRILKRFRYTNENETVGIRYTIKVDK